MSNLPRISGREYIRALNRIGFYSKRQEGSHVVLRRDDPFGQVVVPDHKELDRGTLKDNPSGGWRGYSGVVLPGGLVLYSLTATELSARSGAVRSAISSGEKSLSMSRMMMKLSSFFPIPLINSVRS